MNKKPSPPPAQVGQYPLGRRSGLGRFSNTYELESETGAERDLQLRLVDGTRIQPEPQEAFLAAASAASLIQHERCSRVSDWGADGNWSWFVSDEPRGTPLTTLLENARMGGEPTELSFACALVAEVAQLLEEARASIAEGPEQMTICHGTLHPGSVVLSDQGECQLRGFGDLELYEPVHGDGPDSLLLAGYGSPELWGGGVLDPRSEVFALGTILYELLTGETPFAASSAQEVEQNLLTSRYVPASGRNLGLPPELDALLAGTLQADPHFRLPGPAVIRQELEHIQQQYGLAKGAQALAEGFRLYATPPENDFDTEATGVHRRNAARESLMPAPAIPAPEPTTGVFKMPTAAAPHAAPVVQIQTSPPPTPVPPTAPLHVEPTPARAAAPGFTAAANTASAPEIPPAAVAPGSDKGTRTLLTLTLFVSSLALILLAVVLVRQTQLPTTEAGKTVAAPASPDTTTGTAAGTASAAQLPAKTSPGTEREADEAPAPDPAPAPEPEPTPAPAPEQIAQAEQPQNQETQAEETRAAAVRSAASSSRSTTRTAAPTTAPAVTHAAPPAAAPVSTPAPRPSAPAAVPAATPARAPISAPAPRPSTPTRPSAPVAQAQPSAAASGAATGETGTLNIQSMTPATVTIDGRPQGQTPIQGLVLPVGRYRIHLSNPAAGIDRSYQVSIEAGRTRTIVNR